MVMLYLDIWYKGDYNWKRISEEEIPTDTEEKFVTWQRYVSKDLGQFGAEYGNLVADFDDKVNPNNARLDAIKLYDAFISKGINPKNIKIYFSGKKGFHVELDYRSYMDKPIHELHLIYKMFYSMHKDDLLTLDKTIYSIRKQWRVVNTRHSGSGLFCIQINREELGKSLEGIKTLAKEPRELTDDFEKDDKAKLFFEHLLSEFYKSVDEFKKRQVKIQDISINGVPPCITAQLNQRGLTTMRNEILFHNACNLVALGKTEEEAKEILTGFINGNDYSTSEAEASIRSAYKQERYLSCVENSQWCDKDICNSLMDDGEAKEISEFNARFGIQTQLEVIEKVEQDVQDGYYKPVIKSGLKHIDNKCPILKDHLLVICGNSNEGKTSFLITIMKNNPDKKCLFFSIEEGQERASLRLNYAGYFADNIKHVKRYDNNPITDRDIRIAIKVYKPDYIVIDQLINMEQSKDIKKEERMKYKFLMEQLRILARETSTPIILSHQLNREAISEDIPIKEQIAEGADIERLAIDVWILFRRKMDDKYYNFVNIAKTKMFLSNIVIPVVFNPDTFTLSDFTDYLPIEMTSKFGVSDKINNGTYREIIIKKEN
jgi:hypothetical protein